MNIPNKKRFIRKRHDNLLIDPTSKLSDVIKPLNIKYSCKVKGSKSYGLEISYDTIQKELITFFQNKKINFKSYTKNVH